MIRNHSLEKLSHEYHRPGRVLIRVHTNFTQIRGNSEAYFSLLPCYTIGNEAGIGLPPNESLDTIPGHKDDAIVPALAKWHLVSITKGPLHYVANAVFLWQLYLQAIGSIPPARHSWERLKEHETPDVVLARFKSITIFGCIPGDVLPEITSAEQVEPTVRVWCGDRFTRMMNRFEQDMVSWFGPSILQTDEQGTNET